MDGAITTSADAGNRPGTERPVTLLYFAWLRARIGTGQEHVTLPAEIRTVGQLIDALAARGAGYADALKDRTAIRAAVNQEFATPESPIAPGDEIALFPPVTGG